MFQASFDLQVLRRHENITALILATVRSWEFIEAENYRVLADAIFEFKEDKGVEINWESTVDASFAAGADAGTAEPSQSHPRDKRAKFGSQVPKKLLMDKEKDHIASVVKPISARASSSTCIKLPAGEFGSSHVEIENFTKQNNDNCGAGSSYSPMSCKNPLLVSSSEVINQDGLDCTVRSSEEFSRDTKSKDVSTKNEQGTSTSQCLGIDRNPPSQDGLCHTRKSSDEFSKYRKPNAASTKKEQGTSASEGLGDTGKSLSQDGFGHTRRSSEEFSRDKKSKDVSTEKEQGTSTSQGSEDTKKSPSQGLGHTRRSSKEFLRYRKPKDDSTKKERGTSTSQGSGDTKKPPSKDSLGHTRRSSKELPRDRKPKDDSTKNERGTSTSQGLGDARKLPSQDGLGPARRSFEEFSRDKKPTDVSTKKEQGTRTSQGLGVTRKPPSQDGLGHTRRSSTEFSRDRKSKDVATRKKQETSTLQLLGDSGKHHLPFFIDDITKGEEKVKISLMDENGKGDRPSFFYIPKNLIYQNAHVNISLARISDEDCCSNCSNDCLSLPVPCPCASETGGQFAYTPQGLLEKEFLRSCISMNLEPEKHHLVYCQDCPVKRSKDEPCRGHLVRKFIKECWSKCGCNMQCGNRVVQRGITRNLQVFWTHDVKGWGLRTLENLPKGAFVCEYVGEILTNTELYERNQQSGGNERHTYPVHLDADWGSESILKDEEALCLDATFYGNVARFINHRCHDANLIDIPVEVETLDHHYYHLAFFTTRNVKAFEELTWDYQIDFDDDDHPIKAFQCFCLSTFCRNKIRKGKTKAKAEGITVQHDRKRQCQPSAE
ncbi:hypothetical protein Nepgr_009498 [Nepenthes gracilis]|uniref:Histone-lysine N-methyltransferase SUVR4 n=1 Tax=Nepenthes gracilis TaxID=150966 RepID=A0AAD3SAL7_NEPGR|nr:hypothetical protein Nepgr_009498 [Nepenthes gracilis]